MGTFLLSPPDETFQCSMSNRWDEFLVKRSFESCCCHALFIVFFSETPPIAWTKAPPCAFTNINKMLDYAQSASTKLGFSVHQNHVRKNAKSIFPSVKSRAFTIPPVVEFFSSPKFPFSLVRVQSVNFIRLRKLQIKSESILYQHVLNCAMEMCQKLFTK